MGDYFIPFKILLLRMRMEYRHQCEFALWDTDGVLRLTTTDMTIVVIGTSSIALNL